jgi:predicted naringenin-chalcone synthase
VNAALECCIAWLSDSERTHVTTHPRIAALSTAAPPWTYTRAQVLAFLRERMIGAAWPESPESRALVRSLERVFLASTVETRQSCVDLEEYYRWPRTTGERMDTYATAAYALGRAALEGCLQAIPGLDASSITDLAVVSCTGYTAPGIDILLSRDLGVRPDARRVVIGHMGCFGALVGLRQSLATLRAYPDAVVALLSVEVSSLHFHATRERDEFAMFALFGDGAAAALLINDQRATGPELVDAYCVADFSAAGQMSWTVGDEGFVMGLSPRVPVTLRRHVREATERLLAPHGLGIVDVKHWLIHPGGPSILDAIAARLNLSEEQMAYSWKVLREHGNCSSATVLLVLRELLVSGTAQPGEWGVMMAFGPGLTLESCLLRF